MEKTTQYITAPHIPPAHKAISIWLFTVCAFVVLMVLVGGLTRLTDAGLAITEWKPITGVCPPLTITEWEVEFEKYKTIPEFQLVNSDYSLEEFKFIYWWEWGHRQLGRVVAMVFLIPFIWFAMRKKIPQGFYGPLVSLFLLGGLQGFMGWYMVKSGLTERIDVSQYRLAMHLGLALLIFSYTYWLALDLWRGGGVIKKPEGKKPEGKKPKPQKLEGRVLASFIVLMTFLQSMMGALVAGLDAGKSYTDWPYMDGALMPSGLLDMSPVARNFFENYLTVQFDHRIGAYLLLMMVFVHLYAQYKSQSPTLKTAYLVAFAVTSQAVLGIIALRLAVPLFWGAVHQIGAVMVLAVAITHLQMTRS